MTRHLERAWSVYSSILESKLPYAFGSRTIASALSAARRVPESIVWPCRKAAATLHRQREHTIVVKHKVLVSVVHCQDENVQDLTFTPNTLTRCQLTPNTHPSKITLEIFHPGFATRFNTNHLSGSVITSKKLHETSWLGTRLLLKDKRFEVKTRDASSQDAWTDSLRHPRSSVNVPCSDSWACIDSDTLEHLAYRWSFAWISFGYSKRWSAFSSHPITASQWFAGDMQ